MNRDWKPVVGYEYRYLVSACGTVWDKKNNKEVSQVLSGPNKKRYKYVNLVGDNGRKLVVVHRLVALAFIPKTELGKDFVDHIDRDSENNHYTNLRWVCPRGNMRNTDRNRKTDSGELVVEVVEQKYGAVKPHLANIYGKMKNHSLSFEDAMFEYDYKLETGQEYSEWTSYIEQKYEAFGNKISMQELVEQYGHDKDVVKSRLQQGWSLEEVMSGHRWYDGKHAFLSTHPNCTGKWWPSKARCLEEDGIGDGIWERAVVLGKGGMVDLVGAKKQVEDLNKKEWVVGDKTFFETFEGLCRVFGKDSGAIKTRMSRQGMSLEQALLIKPKRINSYVLDGVLVTNTGVVVDYNREVVKPIQITPLLEGVDHSYFNGRNKEYRDSGIEAATSLLKTLNYFGCNISKLEVTV